MTLEELKEKYPVGCKIQTINDIDKMKNDVLGYGWIWLDERIETVGATLEVRDHQWKTTVHGKTPSIQVARQGSKLLSWSIFPEWIVWVEDKEEDIDQLLKKQRDDILASLFQ